MNYLLKSKIPLNRLPYVELNPFKRRYVNIHNKLESVGQPTVTTHPHLLCTGELLPGLKMDEFKSRRQYLMKLILDDVKKTYGENKHIVAIIPSASRTYMSENIPYIFRQNTDFLYLSGCLEPNTGLLLSGNSTEDFRTTMLLQDSDSHTQLWEGPRTSPECALKYFGVDDTLFIDDFKTFLNKFIDTCNTILFCDAQSPAQLSMSKILKEYVEATGITCFGNVSQYLHNMRLIKSPAEQELMRKAGNISSHAIIKAIQATKPGMTEHQLFAIVDYESRMNGAEILAYPPVVASGSNATIIHYTNNNQILRDGQLVLMDAGCEYHGYAGDISRTWPVSGKFNKYQRILYEIVLDVQTRLITLCGERAPLDTIYATMINYLSTILHREKIVNSEVGNSKEFLQSIATRVCPHHSSHYLGMDVHDVKSIPKNIPLRPGCILTIEPGIYVRANDKSIKPEFWDIGIRIEDDVLITETNYEILSSKCPKNVEDIEKLMNTT